MKLNISRGYHGFDIPNVEEKYGGATYMGDFCTKQLNGDWSDTPKAIFYQPNPNLELGHTHYFGLGVTYSMNLHNKLVVDGMFITNGESAVKEPFNALLHLTGKEEEQELIISCWRHDCRFSQDGEEMIDGGRDYIRTTAGADIVQVTVDGPDFYYLGKKLEVI